MKWNFFLALSSFVSLFIVKKKLTTKLRVNTYIVMFPSKVHQYKKRPLVTLPKAIIFAKKKPSNNY